MKTILKWLLAAAGIYLFEFATGWVRAIDDIGIDVPVMFSKYFLLVVFLIYKKRISIRNACLLFSFTIASIPFMAMIVDGVPLSSISAFLNNAMGILGTWAACIAMSKTKLIVKLLIPVLAAIISIWYVCGEGREYYYNLQNGDAFTSSHYNGGVF